MSPDLQKGIGEILKAFSGGTYNLTFKLASYTNPQTNGHARNYGGNNYEIGISYSNATDPDFSRIWLAKTFIHEAFHAKLMQKAFELLGTNIISQWPKDINDMDLQELMFYFQSASTVNGTWEEVGHAWMLNHINLCAESLQEFVLQSYPAKYNQLASQGITPYVAMFYQGMNGVLFVEEDMFARGLTEQDVALLQAALSITSCPE